MTIEVKFNDSGRKATVKPNPKYPNGIDLDATSHDDRKSCAFNIPYPAPGVGTYSIVCQTCRYTAVVTVAGRADDPRTIKLPCKTGVH